MTHPRHLALAAAAVGLAASSLGMAAVLAAAVGVALVARVVPLVRRPGLAVVAGVLVLTAGSAGDSRVAALEHTRLPALFDQTIDGDMTVLTAPRQDAFGGRQAVVRWRGERVLLRFPPWRRDELPRIGDVVRVAGRLREPDRSARAADAHAALRATAVESTGRRRGALLGTVDAIRRRAEAALDRALPPAEAALMRGMVLGQDEALPQDVRDAFRISGLAHLVAASGQNIMFLVALAIGLSMVAGVGFRARWVLALGLIVVYVPLAGAGAPIQRAAVMGVAMVAARLTGRASSRWYAVVLAAVATLAFDPRSIAAVGWQLSFAAVLGIGLVAGPVRAPLSRCGVPSALAEAVGVTAAATLATAPLMALHFGRLSLVALPANVLAAPAVPVVMWIGMVAAAVAQVMPAAGVVIAGAAALPVAYLVGLAAAAASVPGAEASAPGAAVAVVCAAAAWALIRRRASAAPHGGAAGLSRRRRMCLVAGAAAVLACAMTIGGGPPVAPPAASGHLRITALDIGQGDATLVETAGHAVLVDAGPVGAPVVRRLREAGVRTLDALVITHAQADHDGGVPAVLAQMPVSMLLDGRAQDQPDGVEGSGDARAEAGSSTTAQAVDRSIADCGVRVVAAQAGQDIHVGDLALHVLWPPAGPAPAGVDPNDRAVVLLAAAHGSRALLTADAESQVLAPLELEPVDVLKVSHHGSADDGLPALLERLRPRVALIEVGRGNTYGHPAPTTLQALQAAVPVVRRTDRDGTVSVDLERGAVRAVAGS